MSATVAYIIYINKRIITLKHTNLEIDKFFLTQLTRFYYEEKYFNIARRRSFVALMPKRRAIRTRRRWRKTGDIHPQRSRELGTRAGATNNASDKGGWSNTQGKLSYTLVLKAENDVQILTEDAQGKEVVFTPTVVLGRNYKVTAYAYFGDTAKGSIDAIAESKGINDETKDAYTWTGNINFATDQDGTNQNITLKRPYAKLRLIATDYNEAKTDVKSVTVEYKNQMYTMFNAVEGQFNTEKSVSFTNQWNKDYYEKATTDGSKTIFADYVPVNETGVAPFTVTVEYTNGETYTRTFAEDIPVKRNALTTLKGAFFTAGAQITVNVDDNFENFIPGEGNDKAEEQLRMAAIMGGSYTLPCDITLSEPLKVEADMTLNLNGHIISAANAKGDGAVIEVAEGVSAKLVGGTIKSTKDNGDAAINNAGELVLENITIKVLQLLMVAILIMLFTLQVNWL